MFDLLTRLRNLAKSGTARDTSIVFAGNGASFGFGALFTILSARFLGPGTWGVVAAVMGLVGILSAYGELGLTSGLFRFISKLWFKGEKKRARRIQGAIFTLRVLTALVLTVFLLAFSRQVSNLVFRVDDYLISVAAALGLLGALLVDFQVSTLQSKRKWGLSSFFSASTNLLRLIFLFILYKTSSLTLINLLFVFFGSPLISFALTTLVERPVLVGFKVIRSESKKLLPFTSWMGLNRVTGATASRIDSILMLQLATGFEAGILGAARQLGQWLVLLVASFATVIAPRFAIYEGKNLSSFFKKSVLLSAIVSGGLLVAIVISAPVVSLLGPRFAGSLQVFRWFLVALIPFALSSPAVNAIIYSFKKPKVIALMTTIQLPLVFLGNILLIPKLGVFGPVLVIALWNTSTLVVSYLFVIRHFMKK